MKSWLALARLYEAQQRLAEAKSVYELLLAEDPFLAEVRDRLDLLAERPQTTPQLRKKSNAKGANDARAC